MHARALLVTNILGNAMYRMPNDPLTILLELEAGIVPTSIFLESQRNNVDPFAGLKPDAARVMKRRWRKLKKKFCVENMSLSSASYIIRENIVRGKNVLRD